MLCAPKAVDNGTGAATIAVIAGFVEAAGTVWVRRSDGNRTMRILIPALLLAAFCGGCHQRDVEEKHAGTRVEGGPNERPDYRPVVGRAFNSQAKNDRDRGTGKFPWKKGGSEGWDGGEWNNDKWALQNDPTAPLSPPSVYRAEYTAQTVKPRTTYCPNNITTQAFPNPVHNRLALKELYSQFAFKLGADYECHPVGNKLVFFRQSEVRSGTRGEPLIGLKEGPGDSVLVRWSLQGTEDHARKLSPVGSNRIKRDQWYILEVQLVLSSAVGRRDGVLKTWIRGPGGKPVLIYDENDIRMRNPNDADASEVWSTVHVAPTFGGQGGTISRDFFLFFDHWWVSGK